MPVGPVQSVFLCDLRFNIYVLSRYDHVADMRHYVCVCVCFLTCACVCACVCVCVCRGAHVCACLHAFVYM